MRKYKSNKQAAFIYCKSVTIFKGFVLTFLQVAYGLIVVLQLQVTLAQEEVGLD